jgi:hypothetical protein
MLKRHEVEIFDPHSLSNFGLDRGKNARLRRSWSQD